MPTGARVHPPRCGDPRVSGSKAPRDSKGASRIPWIWGAGGELFWDPCGPPPQQRGKKELEARERKAATEGGVDVAGAAGRCTIDSSALFILYRT